MSTDKEEAEAPHKPLDEQDFEVELLEPAENSGVADQLFQNIARLETDLSKERDERLEERFRWVCAVTVLVNLLTLTAIDGGSISYMMLLLLQLIVLLGYAQKLGVDWAVKLIGDLLNLVSNHLKKD